MGLPSESLAADDETARRRGLGERMVGSSVVASRDVSLESPSSHEAPYHVKPAVATFGDRELSQSRQLWWHLHVVRHAMKKITVS